MKNEKIYWLIQTNLLDEDQVHQVWTSVESSGNIPVEATVIPFQDHFPK